MGASTRAEIEGIFAALREQGSPNETVLLFLCPERQSEAQLARVVGPNVREREAKDLYHLVLPSAIPHCDHGQMVPARSK